MIYSLYSAVQVHIRKLRNNETNYTTQTISKCKLTKMHEKFKT